MPNQPTQDLIEGYNVAPSPEIYSPQPQPSGTQPIFSGWLRNGIEQRDMLSGNYQNISVGGYRSLWLVADGSSGRSELEILPRPFISRVGSKSRPFRLLSGKEITLSEDDIKVYGISKRYQLSDIWFWGCSYVLDPVRLGGGLGQIDLNQSTVCELLFLQDDDLLTWTLNLRKKDDSRVSATEYDIP